VIENRLNKKKINMSITRWSGSKGTGLWPFNPVN